MPSPNAAVIHQIRVAHAIVADACASIHQNPPSHATFAGQEVTQIARSLTPQQNLAIGHLLAGRSFTQTAALVKVDRSTLYRWRQQPAFHVRLAELSAESLEAVAMRTRNLLLRGTAKLEQFLERTASFSDTLRLVSNRRIWEVANVMPREIEESDGTRGMEPGDPTRDSQTVAHRREGSVVQLPGRETRQERCVSRRRGRADPGIRLE